MSMNVRTSELATQVLFRFSVKKVFSLIFFHIAVAMVEEIITNPYQL